MGSRRVGGINITRATRSEIIEWWLLNMGDEGCFIGAHTFQEKCLCNRSTLLKRESILHSNNCADPSTS